MVKFNPIYYFMKRHYIQHNTQSYVLLTYLRWQHAKSVIRYLGEHGRTNAMVLYEHLQEVYHLKTYQTTRTLVASLSPLFVNSKGRRIKTHGHNVYFMKFELSKLGKELYNVILQDDENRVDSAAYGDVELEDLGLDDDENDSNENSTFAKKVSQVDGY